MSRSIWRPAVLSLLAAPAVLLAMPGVVFADNCSGLIDCWDTASAAASAGLGAALGGLGGFFGGGGGGGGDADGAGDPENEDTGSPKPC